MNLHDYDIVVINTSAGKDSLCAIWEICRMADEQNYDRKNIFLSHQDLGKSEWDGTKELAATQAKYFGLYIYYSKRRNKDGYEESLLDYAERRGKWPSNMQRWCTSDFKRGPGARVVTQLTNDSISKVLYVFGFRKTESSSRKKKSELKRNNRLSTQSRIVDEYLPIHDWNVRRVWLTIRANSLPYHFAYDLGMPRLSCVFCIFSPFDALVIAGYHNPELLDKYIAVQDKIGHKFRVDLDLNDVKAAIQSGYKPKNIQDWVM